MIDDIIIENFKSIEALHLPLGRITVLIGENGSGKSNILEAMVVMSAAEGNKLALEVFSSKGMRISDNKRMVSIFEGVKNDPVANFAFLANSETKEWQVLFMDHSFVRATVWGSESDLLVKAREDEITLEMGESNRAEARKKAMREVYFRECLPKTSLPDFIIYSPENTSLRAFDQEGQAFPLGYKGEGLFKVLKEFFRPENEERLAKLKENLALLGWFVNFKLPGDLFMGESRIEITDRFVGKTVMLDQRSANEGFLFLLFYFVLFLSPDTPRFFAIDNIDAALNPKLCAELMARLAQMAKENNKQVLITTHSPAILDGLDLHDEEQKLYVVSRDEAGRTQARLVPPPQAPPGQLPLKLSHAFLRGLLGGLPKNF